MNESSGTGGSRTEPRQWELSCVTDFHLDSQEYEFTLERDDAGAWSLYLHGFTYRDEGWDPEDSIEVPGTSIEWADPDEFWARARQLGDSEYQLHPSYLVAMFRESGDPELANLADALDGAGGW